MSDKVTSNKAGVLLGREQLMAVDFASQNAGRYQMTAVHVLPDGSTEATNGHFAIRVPPSLTSAEEFPAVAGLGGGFNGAGLLIPADVCKAALKALPKRETIPVLRMAHVGAGAEAGHAVVTTTDLETTNARPTKAPDGTFPDLDIVMPPADDTGRVVVGVNAHYLKAIAEYAIKVAGNPKGSVVICMSIKPGEGGEPANSAIRIEVGLPDARAAIVALMPCRT